MSAGDKLSSDRPSITVVIPTRNEARNIGQVLADMPSEIDEIIVVDGNSVDGTIAAARAAWPGIRIVSQGREGKGNALAAGFQAARGDYIVMIDADGSMDPAEIHAFVGALNAGCHYAKGSRFAPGGGSTDISRLRQAGNWALNVLANMLFRTRYTDLCYGYNAFRRECLAAFNLEPAHAVGDARWGDGFEIEALLNSRVAKARLRITEVPSFEHPRRHGESNLRAFPDGLRVLRTLLRERLTRRTAPANLARATPRALPGPSPEPADQSQLEPAVDGVAS
jgi:glycosyltransferase involved in cell wall biosynthesis